MKRHGNLFPQIVEPDNLYEAYRNARRGKTWQRVVQRFDRDWESHLLRLQEALCTGQFTTATYRTKQVTEPKPRTVYVLPFYPDRMAQRILGMGDVVSFVERAQEQYDEQEAERLQKKIRSEEFDLQDFYDQLQRIQKMGSIKELMGMIPGVGNKIRDLDIDEEAFTHIEAIIQSMTPEERTRPDILNGTRRRRIARGSGTEVRDVNQLVSQFEEMKDMMKTMQKMTSQGRDVDMSSLMDKITGGGGGQRSSPR